MLTPAVVTTEHGPVLVNDRHVQRDQQFVLAREPSSGPSVSDCRDHLLTFGSAIPNVSARVQLLLLIGTVIGIPAAAIQAGADIWDRWPRLPWSADRVVGEITVDPPDGRSCNALLFAAQRLPWMTTSCGLPSLHLTVGITLGPWTCIGMVAGTLFRPWAASRTAASSSTSSLSISMRMWLPSLKGSWPMVKVLTAKQSSWSGTPPTFRLRHRA